MCCRSYCLRRRGDPRSLFMLKGLQSRCRDNPTTRRRQAQLTPNSCIQGDADARGVEPTLHGRPCLARDINDSYSAEVVMLAIHLTLARALQCRKTRTMYSAEKTRLPRTSPRLQSGINHPLDPKSARRLRHQSQRMVSPRRPSPSATVFSPFPWRRGRKGHTGWLASNLFLSTE